MLELTRRRFFLTLAASAIAAGVPLPIGFPTKADDRFSSIDDYYTGQWLILCEGASKEINIRQITQYDGKTKTATFQDWSDNPNQVILKEEMQCSIFNTYDYPFV